MFVKRSRHRIISVTDTEGKSRKICKCQLKKDKITEDEKVEFPVYECPEMTRKYGFGTENGLQ